MYIYLQSKGGGWLGNGTLVGIGGDPDTPIPTSQNGLMAIRLFTPHDDGSGEVFEDPEHVKLTTNR